jgi:pyrroloquinoline quinone biosynthesis protein B
LLNASPDVLRQARDNRQLWPRNLRDSPIRGVVLTNGDLDHVLGLLHLRESQPLALYATARVLAGLGENAALRTLERFEGQLFRHELQLGQTCELRGADGAPSGLFIKPDAVAGKPPLHLMGLYDPSPEDNVALTVRTGQSGSLVYASAIADAPAAASLFEGSGALLLDGTFWSEDELPELGVPMGPARSMAHQPIGGRAGSLEALRSLKVPRRIFTHLNNTNPVLDERSAERALVSAAGWEVATDGLLLHVE